MICTSKVDSFGILICVLSFQDIFQIIEIEQQTENQHLFDKIIDVILFDGVEGFDYRKKETETMINYYF